MPAVTIKVFLPRGDPKRLRTAELSNWTGKAVAGPRSELDDLLAREEAARPGVYLLTGADVETGDPAIYIGEAEDIRIRMRAHASKDFWSQLVLFVSKDENLTKAHIRYLEGRLIELAREAGRALVTNGQSSGARLPESDREDMEVFLAKIRQLLPVLGIDVLVPIGGAVQPGPSGLVLTCDVKGYRATGHRVPSGFLVVAGSELVPKLRPSTKKWPSPRILREKLLESGAIAEQGNALVFTRDVEFSSPSSAASVIHGGHVNGLLVWKAPDGRTLKDIESG